MIEPSEIKKKKSLSFFHSAYFYLALPFLIAGCAGEKQSLIYETFKLGIANPHTIIDETPLNPRYRYLKVEANGQPALLILGYVDQKDRVTQDVWYSAFREVIEIKGGRLANTEGLDVNWTAVSLVDPPSLLEALNTVEGARNKRPVRYRYTRIRTVMPGYHVNIRETVSMEAMTEAPSDIPKELKYPNVGQNLRWVKETVLPSNQSPNPSIQALGAVYAIDSKTSEIVYGRQYLTPNFFVSWLTWPYPKKSSNTTQSADSK